MTLEKNANFLSLCYPKRVPNKFSHINISLETSLVARPVPLGRDRSGYVRLPNWSQYDQSP